MKQLMITLLILVLGLGSECLADYYYFRITTDKVMKASFKSNTQKARNAGTRYVIPVSRAQYGTGSQADYDALPSQLIDDGIDAAKSDKAAIVQDVTADVLRAVVAAVIKVVNLRLPADKKITAAEMKAAIKAEL